MQAQEMWQASRGYLTQGTAPYTAWAFYGTDSEEVDHLAHLAAERVKQATTSRLSDYQGADDPLPQEGDHSVILDSRGEAVCVIVDEKVTVVPFGAVDAAYAAREGEGDGSLAFWREAHRKAFPGITDDERVVCEEFRTIYP
ncbi:MAG: ASCH domain-containing protein [Sphaerochaeta sp.]|nr:ASCH domain-containing protein [Sphaerochaeta sp.]MCI2103835.1 ASCH domain-containing protein [Sphaerochaeta sp.]